MTDKIRITKEREQLTGVTNWYDTIKGGCPECGSDRVVTDGMLKVCNDCDYKNYEVVGDE